MFGFTFTPSYSYWHLDVCQPALLSGFGILGGDYLGANSIPRLLLYRRTPFGATVVACDEAFAQYMACSDIKTIFTHSLYNK